MESPGAIGTFGREPTQRVITEIAAAAADPRFRTLADCAPVMLWMSDVDMLVTFVNQGWLDFTGRTFEHERGDGWSASVHPDDFDFCLGTYAGAFHARQTFRMEYRMYRADGEYRWILDTGAPLYTAAGEFAGYIGSCIDITERKQMEEDLRRANAAKDEFLALVSHELRTPLATIFGNAEVMATRGEKIDDKTKHTALEDIRAEAARLQQVIENMLSLARAEARVIGASEPCLVAHVLDRVLTHHSHQHPARKIQVSIEADLPPVAIEETHLEQILLNLIGNAEKYSVPLDLIEILTNRAGHEAEIVILDRGPGIREDELDRVFTAFYRSSEAPPTTSGAGIGLTVCKRLVEEHGGRISLAGRDGGGLVAYITLPFAAEGESL